MTQKKFKLTLNAWQLAALEELLGGSMRADQFDKISFDALRRKVETAWEQNKEAVQS